MLTFYESDESIVLTDGKVVTKAYHHRPSIHSKLVEEYFKGNVNSINKTPTVRPYFKMLFTFDNTLNVFSDSGVLVQTLKPSIKLSPFATTLQLTKKLHPELFI